MRWNLLIGLFVIVLIVSVYAQRNPLQNLLMIVQIEQGTFGVCAQYWRTEEMNACYPDLWTLVKHIGASHISGAVDTYWGAGADKAVANGLKMYYGLTSPAYDPTNLPADLASKEALKKQIDLCKLSQYRDHPGVFAYYIAGEPCGSYSFDPRNPDAAVLDLIEIIKYGIQYIKSIDPTHPVTVALNPAGASVYDPEGVWIEKRKAWISRFIDYVDFLDYHLYLFGDAGTEWWRNPELMRSRLITNLDQVLIPSAKGKPIIIGETGCPSSPFKDWKGEIASFNEQQQADYFRIYGEETRKRGIFVYVFKLIDASTYSYSDYGLFNTENDGTINIPKKAAGLVKNYLSLSGVITTTSSQTSTQTTTTTTSGITTLTSVITSTVTTTITITTTTDTGNVILENVLKAVTVAILVSGSVAAIAYGLSKRPKTKVRKK